MACFVDSLVATVTAYQSAGTRYTNALSNPNTVHATIPSDFKTLPIKTVTQIQGCLVDYCDYYDALLENMQLFDMMIDSSNTPLPETDGPTMLDSLVGYSLLASTDYDALTMLDESYLGV